MKEFNLVVEIVVLSEEVSEVTVEAESLEEAKEMVEQMFEKGELSFDIVDSEIKQVYIDEQ